MNCRDFIIEFEEHRALDNAAQIHLNDCPDCRKATVVQTRIWETIEVFPVIDAPKNFDFRVKARIAAAKPSDFQPKFAPILRYVLPLSAIVLVLGLLASSTTLFFGGNNNSSEVAAIVPPMPVVADVPPSVLSNPVITDSNSARSLPSEPMFAETANLNVRPPNNRREVSYVAANSTRKVPAAPLVKTSKNDIGGSRTSTYSVPPVLTETGSNKTPGISLNSDNNSVPVSKEAIWSLIGVEIVSENGARKVKAVKQSSSAARSGVKIGDVIEAMNGEKLSAQPLSGERIEVKTLTVLRGAERVEISLKN